MCTFRVALTQVQSQALVLVILQLHFVLTQFSSLSSPLCKSSPPSMEETVPPNLMSLANVLRTSSSPVWQIIDENHKEKWPSNGALGNPASDQPPA